MDATKNFTNSDKHPPYDLVVRHPEVRPVYDRQKKQWYLPSDDKKSPAYYHMDKKCLQNVHSDFDHNMVHIPVQVQASLTAGHKHVLALAGFL